MVLYDEALARIGLFFRWKGRLLSLTVTFKRKILLSAYRSYMFCCNLDL